MSMLRSSGRYSDDCHLYIDSLLKRQKSVNEVYVVHYRSVIT